ncbi:MAG: DUF1822 family protein [Xenococcaceae cyanobacterium]
MNSTEKPLIVPLLSKAHDLAREFAKEQDTPEKREQVFLNTLAVMAVHTSLRWSEIETDLEQSDSWHPVKRALFNTADLILPEFGRLECIPVKPGEDRVKLPPDSSNDCIGYVAVQFEEQLSQVKLRGFLPLPGNLPTELPLNQFHPFDSLFDHLFYLEEEFLLVREKIAEKEDNPVFDTVRSTMEHRSISKIVAELNRILEQEESYLWSEKGGDVLIGRGLSREVEREVLASSSREELLITKEEDFDDLDAESEGEIQDFAFELLEDLKKIRSDET